MHLVVLCPIKSAVYIPVKCAVKSERVFCYFFSYFVSNRKKISVKKRICFGKIKITFLVHCSINLKR